MRAEWFILGSFFSCASALSFHAEDFEAVEDKSLRGEVHLSIGSSKMTLVGKCVSAQRTILVQNPEALEITIEHFEANGSVRQYGVKFCGQELGFVRVERTSFLIDSQYSQPRLSLTDPSGRIIGEIANAENQERFFFLRDSTSHIIGRAHLGEDGKWKVKSELDQPILMGVLLFASRMEMNACEVIVAQSQRVKGIMYGAAAMAVAVLFYWIFP